MQEIRWEKTEHFLERKTKKREKKYRKEHKMIIKKKGKQKQEKGKDWKKVCSLEWRKEARNS